jgi:hypothetical protein
MKITLDIDHLSGGASASATAASSGASEPSLALAGGTAVFMEEGDVSSYSRADAGDAGAPPDWLVAGIAASPRPSGATAGASGSEDASDATGKSGGAAAV